MPTEGMTGADDATIRSRSNKRECRRWNRRLLVGLLLGWWGCWLIQLGVAGAASAAVSPEPEEYAVYRVMIHELVLDDGVQSVVIEDETDRDVQGNIYSDDGSRPGLWGFLSPRLPTLPQAVAVDYQERNRRPAMLEDHFDLRVPCVLLNKEDEQRLGEAVVTHGRGEFDRHYPHTPGVLALSRVGFDRERNQALVHVENRLDSGYAFYVWLEKQQGQWVVRDKVNVGIRTGVGR